MTLEGQNLHVIKSVRQKNCRTNIVGWKMTYMYDGFKIIANGLRSLDRLGAFAP